MRNQRPCLIAALGGGLNTLPKIAAEELAQTAKAAVARFAKVFEQGQADGSLDFSGQTTDAAMAFFAMLQGLQVLARASGSTDAYRAAARTYIDSITSPSGLTP